ncbi:unnamed protein product [Angiostrongylus costaricensis]|uniref:EGF-like domain-containing protein n=1 Tax=Angiostrongylus costaricensis TaxID=334426 RepID=A0A158PMG9_ANGCS|nr:unnamed protein product [Angiostrongylus costaricensis]
MCRNLTSGVFECDCHEDFKPNGSHCDPRETVGSFVTVVGNSFIMTSSVKWDEFSMRFQRTISRNRRLITATMDSKRNLICYLMAAVKADPLTYAFMECSRITKKSWKTVKTDITASFPFDEVRMMHHDPIDDNWLFLVGRTRLIICKNDAPPLRKCKITVDDVDIEDFVVDSATGLIFYSTTGRNAGVWRVSYENRTKLSMSKRVLQMPAGLAVDPFSKTLYYSDRYFERIFAIDYGNTWTTRSVIHDRRLKYSTSLAFFTDYLYVPSRSELLRVDTITSKTEVVNFHAPISGFFVNHNLSAPRSSGIPLLTCMAVDSLSGNIYYGTRPSVATAGITVFHPKNPNRRAQVVKAIGGVFSINVDSMAGLEVLVGVSSFNPTAVAIDVETRRVYWLDPSEYVLHWVGYNLENNQYVFVDDSQDEIKVDDSQDEIKFRPLSFQGYFRGPDSEFLKRLSNLVDCNCHDRLSINLGIDQVIFFVFLLSKREVLLFFVHD